MIQMQTMLDIADNTGAKVGMCIRVIKASNKKYARIGDMVVLSVKKAIPNSPIEEGSVVKGVVIRTKKPYKREDGTTIRFDDNAVVIVDDEGNPKGTRIFGPVARELRKKNYTKIISLAPEVV